MHDLVEQHPLIATERQFAGQKREQHYTQGVNVAATIDMMSLPRSLFGTHVSWCAQNLPFQSHCDLAGIALGQPEIHHAGNTLLRDHDI